MDSVPSQSSSEEDVAVLFEFIPGQMKKKSTVVDLTKDNAEPGELSLITAEKKMCESMMEELQHKCKEKQKELLSLYCMKKRSVEAQKKLQANIQRLTDENLVIMDQLGKLEKEKGVVAAQLGDRRTKKSQAEVALCSLKFNPESAELDDKGTVKALIRIENAVLKLEQEETKIQQEIDNLLKKRDDNVAQLIKLTEDGDGQEDLDYRVVILKSEIETLIKEVVAQKRNIIVLDYRKRMYELDRNEEIWIQSIYRPFDYGA